MSSRTYTFGREIVQFRLDVHDPQEGDYHLLDPNEVWNRTSLPFSPETLKPLMEDDEETDLFFATVSHSSKIIPDPFVATNLKVLKPVWLISLAHFGGGGLDYEMSEGFFEDNWREDLLITAAEEFKKRLKKVQKHASDPEFLSQVCPKIMPAGVDWDQFYAVINAYGTGRNDFWEDNFEFHIEFEGVLNENDVPLA